MDLRSKIDGNRTQSIGCELLPRIRLALSLLSVFLFGTDFRIDLNGDVQWWAAFSRKADAKYNWPDCAKVRTPTGIIPLS